MPTCFVVMPITTRPVDVDSYWGDDDHFSHVFEHLLRPALEAAQFDVTPPTAEGADLIHAEIVRNLETSDLVLCDISTLNPNVFFELGIRVALDRPVALVRDTLTSGIPFDTAVINVHQYDARLVPWTLDAEVDRLRAHVEASSQRSDGRNALWRYFGLTQRGAAPDVQDPVSGKLDIVMDELVALRRERRRESSQPLRINSDRTPPIERIDQFVGSAMKIAGVSSASYSLSTPEVIEMTLKEPISRRQSNEISALAAEYGVTVHLTVDTNSGPPRDPDDDLDPTPD